jgi:hypothetical protein
MKPSDYNPLTDSTISVDMVIKNQGTREADPFYVGLYYNLSTPPDIYTWKNKEEYVDSLMPGDTTIVTFTGVTSSDTATWNMYGLVDCYDWEEESDENNNYIGPKTVKWRDINSLPDLVIEEVLVSGYCPYTTDSVFVYVTIKNQGESVASNPFGFYTDIFYDTNSAPVAPAFGNDWHPSPFGLYPGDIDTFTFVLPSPVSGTTWSMWLLVDSDNDIEESNESNNVYGPIEIEWMEPPAYRITSITRDHIIENVMGFTLIEWVCPAINASPPGACSQWHSNYIVDSTYYGEAYEWGGSDDTAQFRCNLGKGLRAGALGVSEVCKLPKGGYPWATGVECCGLVWHSLEAGYHTTKNLEDVGSWIAGWVEYLLKGDFLLTYDKHTFIFESWAGEALMNVIEAGDFRDRDLDHSSEARRWPRADTFYTQYNAYKYNNVQESPGYNPNRAGDANSDGKVDAVDVIHLINYLFKGSGIRPHPNWRGDANGDCKVSLSDIVYLINYLYKGGPPPYYYTDCPGRTCFYY